MTGNRMSWSHWIQHYPPAPSHVYALMHCRACTLVRRLPLFALMSAPSEVATFTCAGVSRQCEVPDSDVCPWVAWEVAPPLVYTLTNEPTDVANTSSSATNDPPASSPSSRRRSSRSSLDNPSDRNFSGNGRTSTAIIPRERSNSRRVGIARLSWTPPRSPREVKRERPTRSSSRAQGRPRHPGSPSPSPSSSPSNSSRSSDSEHSGRGSPPHQYPSLHHYSAFDPFGCSRPEPRHFIIGRELKYFSEPPPTRAEDRKATSSRNRSSTRREQREFDKWGEWYV